MRIRRAEKADFAQILSLAKKYNLDYADMEADDFWVASEAKTIAGICGLKKHPDCRELCALGVEERFRKQGLGRELVAALLEASAGDIYLATVIPEFFKKFGFEKAARIPPSMVKKEEWCAGCSRDLCHVMVKKRQ